MAAVVLRFFMSFPFEGVAGGTASGKSTVCSTLVDKLGQSEVRAFLRFLIVL